MPEVTELVTDTARISALSYLITQPKLIPVPAICLLIRAGRAGGRMVNIGVCFDIREKLPLPSRPQDSGGASGAQEGACLWALSRPRTRKPVPLGPAASHTALFLPSTSVTSLTLPDLERPSGQSGCPRKNLHPEATVVPAAVSR